jgi:hypothetical protein
LFPFIDEGLNEDAEDELLLWNPLMRGPPTLPVEGRPEGPLSLESFLFLSSTSSTVEETTLLASVFMVSPLLPPFEE